MNFYKDHAATFLKLKFIVILTKKPQTLASKMWERSCWGFSWNTWKISLRLHKYGFVLLNSLRIAANTIFCNPKTANYWKRSKKGFPSKNLCKYSTLLHNYTQMVGLQIRFSQKKKFSFYLHRLRSYRPKKVKIADYMMTYSVVSVDATQKMWWFLASWCWELFNDI